MYSFTNQNSLTDEEIIHQLLPNQPNECFESLYNRYVTKVYRRCLSMTKDSEAAQDFTHDIFVKVFDKLGSFKQQSSFSTWLYSVSYNYCADQLRLGKRLPYSTLDTTYEQNIRESDENCLQEEVLQLVNKAMHYLSVDERHLLKLKYEDQLSIDDMAQIYLISPSAVKMRLKRSRDKLREIYDKLAIL